METFGNETETLPFLNENEPTSQDSDCLRKILPCEIWQLVTSRLADQSDDLNSLTNSSPYFRNMSSPKRTLFLFKKVFTVVAPTIWKNEGESGLPISSVFQCRGVCSPWNNAVDKLLEEKFDNAELPDSLNNLINFTKNTKQEKVFLFLEHFETSHAKPEVTRNPFIWKTLRVRTTHYGHRHRLTYLEQRYLNALSSTFRMYGRHIDHFKLEISGNFLHIEDCLKIQDWLVHMPNLKSLIIINSAYSFERNLSLKEFQTQLISDPNFTRFPKLALLETVIFRNLRSPIFNQFIQPNFHITSLNLSYCDAAYNFFNLPFQNLTKFIIEINSVEMFEKLNSSSKIPWPKIYYMSIIFTDKTKFIRLSEILNVLQNKFCSLESLYLQLPKAKTNEEARKLWEESKRCRLELPSLSGIHLTLRDPTSLDFLLPIKNILEELTMEIRYPTTTLVESGTHTTIVKFNGFEHNILDSNIPTIFTKLTEIGVIGNKEEEEKWYYL